MTGIKKILMVFLVSLLAGTGMLPSGMARAEDEKAAVAAGGDWQESQVVKGKVLVKYKNSASTGTDARAMGTELSRWTVLAIDEEASVSEQIARLKNDPDVEYAEPVYKVKLIAEVADTAVTNNVYSGPSSYMEQWGRLAGQLDNLEAYSPASQRQGVTVAVMDTGADLDHPALKDSIVEGYDFVNNDNVPEDDNGHGTHVSGIIAADSQSGKVAGVAHGVRIMPLKVLDKEGKGDTALLVEALQMAIDRKVDVVSMSLGVSADSQALHEAIKSAYGKGIVMAAAVGNDSNHWINNESGQLDWDSVTGTAADTVRKAGYDLYPAAYDEVVAVGAICQLPDGSYGAADFTNAGKVDVVAPGVRIFSTYLNGQYDEMSGTSQATPFAAGLAALLKAGNSALNAEDIAVILRTSAQPVQLKGLNSSGYAQLGEELESRMSDWKVYGSGLISGLRAFTVPRLKARPAEEVDLAQNRQAAFDVALLDVHNTVVESTYRVQLTGRNYNETSYDRELDAIRIDPNDGTGALAEGKTRLSAAVTGSELGYHLYLFGEWEEPLGNGETVSHRSNLYTAIKRPGAPQVSLASGAYTGSQTVVLSTPYSEGSMRYFLVTSSGVTSGYADANRQITLTIKEDAALLVQTLHNQVESGLDEYDYVIKAAAPPALGGGGGGFMMPVDKSAELLKALETQTELVVQAENGAVKGSASAELNASVLLKAAELKKNIVIQGDGVAVKLLPGAVSLQAGEKGTFRLEIAKSDAEPVDGMRLQSAVYDLKASLDGKDVSFARTIPVSFQLDKTKLHAAHQVYVYTYDESGKAWRIAGGQWDAGSGVLTAPLSHFSKYAAMEADKTFNDIDGHWARLEMEALAARGIIDGMEPGFFKPEELLTRAQFAALLARQLDLKSPAALSGFGDVEAGEWYAPYVYAAKEAGLISGIGDGLFGPDQHLNREQLAVLLVNAYFYGTGKKAGDMAVTAERKYSDEGIISQWAQSSVRIASALGLMGAMEGDQFKPGESVTRAQAAATLYRLVNLVENERIGK